MTARCLLTWRRGAFLGAALLLAAGCDFTPVLDIPLPEHEPGLVLSGVLVADSTAAVTLSTSGDPYDREPRPRTEEEALEQFRADLDRLDRARVDLLRDGIVVETMQRGLCRDVLEREEPIYAPGDRCGPHRSTTRVEAGATYAVRVTSPDLPNVEATVTVPARVEVSEVTAAGGDRVSFRLSDPVGVGQHYAVQLAPLTQVFTYTERACAPPDFTVCRDTTITQVFTSARGFTTSDPFLTAAARVPANVTLDIVTLEDRTFDGDTRSFSLLPRPLPDDDRVLSGGRDLWLVTLDEKTYQAYQASVFSLGDDNPFEEPANLPSNVEGGYGLVGGATVHARPLPKASASR